MSENKVNKKRKQETEGDNVEEGETLNKKLKSKQGAQQTQKTKQSEQTPQNKQGQSSTKQQQQQSENGTKQKKQGQEQSKKGSQIQKENGGKSKKVSKIEEKQEKKVESVSEGTGVTSEQKNLTLSQIRGHVLKLWSKELDKEKKREVVDDMLNKFGNILHLIALKKDGSRALQAALKYGSENQREHVFTALFKGGNLEEIIKSKYGHFIALKMIKYFVKKFKNSFFDVLLKNVYYFVSHVEGAKVVDRFARDMATPQQFSQLKKVFTSKIDHPENGAPDLKSEQSLENLAMKIVEKHNHYPLLSKHILSLALPIMVPAEREKIVEHLVEKFEDLLDDKEGNRLAIMIINYSDVKQRKSIAKFLKEKTFDILTTENSLSYTILQKLISTVDDTVLIGKMILKEVSQNFSKIMESKTGFSFVASIFAPKHSAVRTFEIPVEFSSSKKDEETRNKEIATYLIDDCVDYLKEANREEITKDPRYSRFTSSVLRFILKENLTRHFSLVNEILSLYLDDKQFKQKDVAKTSYLAHPDAHRIFKAIISSSKDFTAEAKKLIDEKIQKLTQILTSNLEVAVNHRSLFILVALIESTNHKNELIKKLKALKLDKEKLEANIKGSNLLFNLLN